MVPPQKPLLEVSVQYWIITRRTNRLGVAPHRPFKCVIIATIGIKMVYPNPYKEIKGGCTSFLAGNTKRNGKVSCSFLFTTHQQWTPQKKNRSGGRGWSDSEGTEPI